MRADAHSRGGEGCIVGGDPTPTQHTHTHTQMELPSVRGECNGCRWGWGPHLKWAGLLWTETGRCRRGGSVADGAEHAGDDSQTPPRRLAGTKTTPKRAPKPAVLYRKCGRKDSQKRPKPTPKPGVLYRECDRPEAQKTPKRPPKRAPKPAVLYRKCGQNKRQKTPKPTPKPGVLYP